MNRAITTPFALSIGLWFSVLALQSVAAQTPPIGSIAPIRVSDLGLEDRIASAIDLVGPEQGLAGEHRTALVERLQCWIDGVAGCAAADINDPRVRAIRRHLSFGDYEQDGTITVEFSDRSRVELRLERRHGLDPVAWDERAYAAEVLPDTVHAPGVPDVPSRLSELERLAYDVDPAIESALERLKHRLEASIDSTHAAHPSSDPAIRQSALAQEQAL